MAYSKLSPSDDAFQHNIHLHLVQLAVTVEIEELEELS